MSAFQPSFLVAIPTTFARGDLEPLLSSLLEAAEHSIYEVRVLVIDNSGGGYSQQSWIQDIEDERLLFEREKRPGVVHARNRALDVFYAGNDSDLVFLDDDQIVDSDWINSLGDARLAYPNVVLSGPVDYIVPANVEDLYVRKYFSSMRQFQEGEVLRNTGTGNTMIPRAALESKNLPKFDERFNRIGGEDTDFFGRLTQTKGVTIIGCCRFPVFEIVDADRMNRRWIRSRLKLSGVSRAELLNSRVGAVGEATRRMFGGALYWGWMLIRTRRFSAQAESPFLRGLGFLAWVLGAATKPTYGE